MADTEAGQPYSPMAGLMFVFNLIVGTGALAMPKAFAGAGWLNSLVLVCALAVMSYVTCTFVNEAMSIANAFLAYKKATDPKPAAAAVGDKDEEDEPLLVDHEPSINENEDDELEISPALFEIKERVEMGKMAGMFYSKWGLFTFYCCISIYLFGDLAIYAAAVPKSLRNVACTYTHDSHSHGNLSHASSSCDSNLTNSDPCWSGHDITRAQAYRIFVAIFSVCLGSFVFFNPQKTFVLQIITAIMRWLAFAVMIILCIIKLSKGQGGGQPKVVNFYGIPTLFGVCVYSFMCHHSLPSLVTPITDKSRLYFLLAIDYILILGFYSLLSFTGIFTFGALDDIYTLNFLCDTDTHPITSSKIIEYFLALFPVFTLSTNFPIIAISLRNNIKTLFHRESKPYHWVIDRVVFPLVTIIPPIIVAFCTDNVELLVSITGSYAGASIQYFIPVGLVFFARRQARRHEVLSCIENRYTSPFKHTAWLVVVLVWAIIAVIFVTINHVLQWEN